MLLSGAIGHRDCVKARDGVAKVTQEVMCTKMRFALDGVDGLRTCIARVDRVTSVSWVL